MYIPIGRKSGGTKAFTFSIKNAINMHRMNYTALKKLYPYENLWQGENDHVAALLACSFGDAMWRSRIF
jgi:hypothetical protein